ncbi:MAG: glycosyltransferase, partial [Candidatus Marithrix sp.]|nr:glycosyltransferase [Candidatus Marithrix sp.]
MQKISFVVPIYNEEKNISLLYSKIIDLMIKLKGDWELIFINDGSYDNTLNILKQYSSTDKRV